MEKVKVLIDSIGKVKGFVNIVSKFDTEVNMVSGCYVIDTKSIMGIFSLDLSSPIDLVVHAKGEKLTEILEKIKDYVVD